MTVGRLKELLANVPDNVMLAVENRRGGAHLVCNLRAGSIVFDGHVPGPLKGQARRATDNYEQRQILQPEIVFLEVYRKPVTPPPVTFDEEDIDAQARELAELNDGFDDRVTP